MADVETIHQEMLAELSDSYQKTPGFPAFDFLRAFALAVSSLAGDVEAAEARLDPDNLTGADLDLFVWQHRGLERKYASFAEATLRVTAGAGTIQEGDLFATATGVQYYATQDVEAVTGTTFAVRAEEAGSAGNAPAGTITVMPVTIQGIGGVVNDAAAAGGYDEETDDSLRERYYDALQHPSNGGNVSAYRQWAMDEAGVGRVTVFPTPAGPNTVEVCVVDEDGGPASPEILARVQARIDPNHNGDGMGESPIGAVCAVTAPSAVDITVSAVLTLAEGASQAVVEAAVQAALDKTVRTAALEGGVLRYAKIADAVLAEGVEDYADLTLNGATASIAFGAREVPVLREVVLTYAGS